MVRNVSCPLTRLFRIHVFSSEEWQCGPYLLGARNHVTDIQRRPLGDFPGRNTNPSMRWLQQQQSEQTAAAGGEAGRVSGGRLQQDVPSPLAKTQ